MGNMTAQEVHVTFGAIMLIIGVLAAAIGAGCGEEKNHQAETVFMSIGACFGGFGVLFLLKWLLMFFIQ